MANPSKNTVNNSSEKTSYWRSPSHILLLIGVLLVLLIAASLISRNNDSNSNTTKTNTTGSASLKMLTTDAKPVMNSNVTITVNEDSGSQSVNAVQANISYPTDKLEFVGIDTSESAFEIQALSTSNNGAIVLARGHKGSLNGSQEVAKITFKVISEDGIAEIKFTEGTALITSTTNEDILKDSTGASLTLGAN